MDKKNAERLDFIVRQALDVVAPTNFPLTNPDVLVRTQAEGGLNFVHGFWNFMDDLERLRTRQGPQGCRSV